MLLVTLFNHRLINLLKRTKEYILKAFTAQGMQIAAGVPLQIGEAADYQSFRIELFGLDKLNDVDAAVERFETVLSKVLVLVA